MSIVEPKLAATVLLVRDRNGLEVLMVERHEQAFFASALVFPGGMVDPEDHHDAWLELTSARDALPTQERAVRIAGFRELYEETGVLLIDADEEPDDTTPHPAQQPFIERVAKTGSRLDLGAMHPFAHWITPESAPRRFDTHFRLCGLDTSLTAVSDGFETVRVEWLRPKDALDLGASGERKLLFPTRLNLELLGKSNSVEQAIDAAKARPIVTVSPRLEKRPDGAFLVIPPDAGYGPAEEDVRAMRG
jgi:8-oxo-dGTP pyrophosphatase MutT (NUDIX family)